MNNILYVTQEINAIILQCLDIFFWSMLRICYYLGTGYGFISSKGIWINRENFSMKSLSSYLSHLLVLWCLPQMLSFNFNWLYLGFYIEKDV